MAEGLIQQQHQQQMGPAKAEALREHSAEFRDPLVLMDEVGTRQDGFLYSFRAAMYTWILYTHGLQNFVYSLQTGGVVNLDSFDEDRLDLIFNVILPAIEKRKAMVLSREPRRMSIPMDDTERSVEAARFAERAMDWGAEYHRIRKLSEKAADLLVKTGNFYHELGWDPLEGPKVPLPDGQEIPMGMPTWRIASAFEWHIHPQAESVEESEYAFKSVYVSRDWVEEHYGEAAYLLPDSQSYYNSDDHIFEKALQNLSPTHGGWSWGSSQEGIPQGRSYMNLMTCYWRNSPSRPEGRMIMCLAQGGKPYIMLHDGPNPYYDWETGKRILPIVHVGDIPVPHRHLCDSMVQYAMPQQDAINAIRGDIYANAEMIGNPKILVSDGVAEESWNNDVGGMVKYAPGSTPPGFLQPPEMPMYMLQGEQAALQFLEILFRPAGPLGSDDKSATSGIQEMIQNEERRTMATPLANRWDEGWNDAWKIWINCWRSFAEVPRQVGSVGENEMWRSSYFSGPLARENFTVRVEIGSSIPNSRVATFAEWIELIKAGAAPIQFDQHMAREFWNDIGKGSMARTFRDHNADMDAAHRNISRVREGMTIMARPQDDPDTHLAVYNYWMKTPEYEEALAQDPMLEARMGMLIDSFIMVKNQIMMQALQGQLMMQGAGAGIDAGMQAMMNPQAARTQGAAQAKSGSQTSGDSKDGRSTQGLGGAHAQSFTPGGGPPGGFFPGG